jgi:hypothetical protein
MTTAAQTGDVPFEREEHKAKRLALLMLGGLLIGLAASLPLAAIWPDVSIPPASDCLIQGATNPVERIRLAGKVLPLPCMPTLIFIQPAVCGGFLGAGLVFGLIAHQLAGRGSKLLLSALGGFSFLFLSFLGSLAVPRIAGPDLALPLSSGVAEPFAIMTFGIAFLFALSMGLALRTPGILWRALVIAAAAGLCQWLVMWLLLGRSVMIWTHDPTTPPLADSLPRLGNEMGPMLTTTMIGNLISGTIGGWVTLALLAARLPAGDEKG